MTEPGRMFQWRGDQKTGDQRPETRRPETRDQKTRAVSPHLQRVGSVRVEGAEVTTRQEGNDDAVRALQLVEVHICQTETRTQTENRRRGTSTRDAQGN